MTKWRMPTLALCMSFLILSHADAKDNPKLYTVLKAVSGDSIQLESGTVIKYSSITAPDITSDESHIKKFAEESLHYNHELVAGKRIRVEWAHKLKNSDGIYTPYVFLEDGTFVNKKILEAGYAKLSIEPPNLEYSEELESAARNSRRNQLGLWSYEDDYKQKHQVIGNKMTKKFYYRDDPFLDDIPRAHQKEFLSPVNALANGYKPSYEYRNSHQQKTDLY